MFIKFLKEGDAIFCHNSPFDRSFMSMLFERTGIPTKQQPKYWFDTATLAYLFRLKGNWEKVSLDYCAQQLGVDIKRSGEHDAIEDCLILKEVYFKMMEIIELKFK